MAEAMLEDEYKTSHQNLKEWGEREQATESSSSSSASTTAMTATATSKLESSDSGTTLFGAFARHRRPSSLLRDKYHSSTSLLIKSGILSSSTANMSGCMGGSGGGGPKKSVAIRLPPSTDIPNPPPKRARIHSSCSTQEVIQAIHTSFTEEDRLTAIQRATQTFDHNIQNLHDGEIDAGADVALTKHLIFLSIHHHPSSNRSSLSAQQQQHHHETCLTCEALECILRASANQVSNAYQHVGPSLLKVLVALIEEEVDLRIQAVTPDASPAAAGEPIIDPLLLDADGGFDDIDNADTQQNDTSKTSPSDSSRSVTPPPERKKSTGIATYDRDQMLEKIAKILGHFARVGAATRSLAHFPGLLGSVLNLINIRPFEAIPWQARLSCLWVVANLACNTENMQMMMCTPTLINSLVSLLARPLDAGASLQSTMEVLRSRSITTRAILNLSWLPENKTPLATNFALLQQLVTFAIQRDHPFRKSKTIQDIVLQTRRHSIGAVRNLAAASRKTKILLCEYDKGKVLEILTDAALNDDDANVRDLTFAAIHNLAIQDTAEMMVKRPSLVMALKNQLLTEEEAGAPPNDPKSHASSTLLVLERSITPDMDAYENLRMLLDAVNPTPTMPDQSVQNVSADRSSNANGSVGNSSDDDSLQRTEAVAV